MKKNIAVFGGSFNPPHIGHVMCALYAHATYNLDEIWVMPTYNHPYFKKLLPFRHRLQMCELAFSHIDNIVIRKDEKYNESGKTWDLIEFLEKENSCNWFFIGGSDIENDIKNWYNGEKLFEKVTIIPVPRGGYTDEISLPQISSSEIRKKIKASKNINKLVPKSVEEYIRHENLYLSNY